jgi:hypothetical protein
LETSDAIWLKDPPVCLFTALIKFFIFLS